MQVLMALALFIAVLASIFALQNSQPVLVKILGWQTQGSLALVVLGTFALGFLSSLLMSTYRWLKTGMETRSLRRRVLELERQLAARPTVVEAPTSRSPF